MILSLFLPHTGVFGGVRRYLELGNVWVDQGNAVTLYHPSGDAPAWLPFRGETVRLDRSGGRRADVAFCSDPHTYASFRSHPARIHVYYCVLERDPGLPRALADTGVRLAANSSPLRRALARRSGRAVLDGVGGIDPDRFHPDPARRAERPLRVLINGRRSRPKKGTDLVLSALGSLRRGAPEFEIVLFDHVAGGVRSDPRSGASLPPGSRLVLDPTQEELVALYQSAHVFVAAERKAGWCNTAIEAMACGAAVACTRSGTTDFARHLETAVVIPIRHPYFIARAVRRLLRDSELRQRLAGAGPRAAAPWSWDRLARRLLDPLAGG